MVRKSLWRDDIWAEPWRKNDRGLFLEWSINHSCYNQTIQDHSRNLYLLLWLILLVRDQTAVVWFVLEKEEHTEWYFYFLFLHDTDLCWFRNRAVRPFVCSALGPGPAEALVLAGSRRLNSIFLYLFQTFIKYLENYLDYRMKFIFKYINVSSLMGSQILTESIKCKRYDTIMYQQWHVQNNLRKQKCSSSRLSRINFLLLLNKLHITS